MDGYINDSDNDDRRNFTFLFVLHGQTIFLFPAPCEDPMMRASEFVMCTPGRQSSCPGSCHDCQRLTGGFDMGLCCPQITRRGCGEFYGLFVNNQSAACFPYMAFV